MSEPTTTPAKRTPPRLLRVRRTEQLSAHMRRIILGGPELAGFPPDSDGAHIKLLLARDGQSEPVLPTLGPEGPRWPPPEVRPIARTYTVARHDPVAGELSVDMVLHDDDGPASRWARHARPGDAVGVAGPGGPPRHVPGADHFYLFGDPSAVPALASVLAALPTDAVGAAFIEVAGADDIQALVHPPGVSVQWLVRGVLRAGASRLLLDAARALAWPAGQVSVTLAGESHQVVALRAHLIEERKLPREALYAVPYWKDEHDEEAYHAERHRIMDAFEA